MKKYIFFRTDRIGDFLVSLILIQSIRRNDPKAHITVIASNKNYSYIKSLKSIDETILYPNGILKRFIFIVKMLNKNFNAVFALDGKKRSIYSSILIKSRFKFLLTTKILYKKLLNLFFYNIIYEKEYKNKLEEIKSLLSSLKYNFKNSDLNVFENERTVKKIPYNLNEEPILFHFDEKWIFNEYIQKYTKIEPGEDELRNFIKEIILKTNKNLFITTGLKNNKLIESIKKNFTLLEDNTYFLNINNKKVILFVNKDFNQIQEMILVSKIIICCHGAVSHVAAGFNKKIIDIYDQSEEQFYNRWTSHFRNYNFLYRENFSKLSEKILYKLILNNS